MSTQNEYQNVCRNIRYLRKANRLSRTAMARKLHITLKTLDLLESGVFPERINIALFFHVNKAFGVTPKRLLTVSIENEAGDLVCGRI